MSPDIEQKDTITGNGTIQFTNINGIVTYIAVAPIGTVIGTPTARVDLLSGGTYTIKSATSCSSRVTLISIPDGNHFSCSRSNKVNIVIAGANAADKFNVVIHSLPLYN